MPFPAASLWPVCLCQNVGFFLEESTIAYLSGVVNPLLGPGIVHYV